MKNCLFSVSYAGLWGQATLDLEAVVAKAAALGFEGIEIMCKRPHLYPFDATADSVSRLKDALAKHRVKAACLAAYTHFSAGGESREVPLLDLQVSYVRRIGEIANALGCRLIRVFTGYETPHEPFDAQWRKVVTGIRACCDAVADQGVTIGIQNHHDIGVDTASLHELYLEIDRKNLGLMVDAWSMHLRGEDLRASLKRVGNAFVFSTVADYVVLKRYRYNPDFVNYEPRAPALVRAVPMGEGDLDYRTYFAALREMGYSGWVSYETCSPLRGGGSEATLDRYARHFLAYMAGLERRPRGKG